MKEFFLNTKEWFDEKRNLPYVLGLLILCCFFFFMNLNSYKLIDCDETKYVSIASAMFANGDFITPYLNFKPIFTESPLFYWVTQLSYIIFGSENNFTSRLPEAVFALMGVLGTYFYVSFILKSKTSGFLSSLVLMSAFWYALFAHLAMPTIGFGVFAALALYAITSTLFVQNKGLKHLLWYLGCAFFALALLQKGIIYTLIPIISAAIVFAALKKIKEALAPTYSITGIIIFLLITIPWYYFAYKLNGKIWLDEYFFSYATGKNPILYAPVIIGSFLPWTPFLAAAIIKGAKYVYNTVKSAKSIKPLFSHDTNDRTLVLIATINSLVIFVLISILNIKFPEGIFLLIPWISILTGYFWHGFLIEDKNKKYIEISALITLLIFIAAGFFGMFYYIAGGISMGLELAFSVFVFSIFGFVFLVKKNKIWLFGTFVALSFCLFVNSGPRIFNFVTNFGQNELEQFTQQVVEDKNEKELITLGFANKYSILNIYKDKPVYFISNKKNLENVLKDINDGQKTIYIIVKNGKMNKKTMISGYNIIGSRKKYSLYSNK